MAAALLHRIDLQLEKLTSSWNIYTTVLCLVIAGYVIYPLIFSIEADTHYFLLARQSSASRIRQAGETSIYRSPEIPHGYPLKSGLGVKDAGAPRWSMGRDGDLRDVWRRAVAGQTVEEGKPKIPPGKVFTLLGKEEVIENTFEKLSADLNAIGKNLKNHGVSRVAIYLPNSPEFLVGLFASLFYGLTPILISQEQTMNRLGTILKKTKADALIVGAGSVPLKDLAKQYASLKEVIWVVSKSSRHLDWNEVAEGEGGKTEIAVWHDIVDEEGAAALTALPANEAAPKISNLIVVSPPTEKLHDYKIIEYTQRNLTSAIAAQLSSLAYAHRVSSKDLLLCLLPLTDSYAFSVTMAALFANASIALTSVTGSSVTYDSAFHSSPQIAPTVILIHPTPLYLYEMKRRSELQRSGLNLWANYRHNRLLSHLKSTGAMPSRSSLPIPKGQESLRLIYTTGTMLPAALDNLRVFTGARVVVGFTDPQVAGAITQTHILDYRATRNEDAHFGGPLSCLELKLTAAPGYTLQEEEEDDGETAKAAAAAGQTNTEKEHGGILVVKGPAVVRQGLEEREDGEVILRDAGIFHILDDGTLTQVKRGPPDREVPPSTETAMKDVVEKLAEAQSQDVSAE